MTSVTLDICRTQRNEGTTSKLDCSMRKLSELPESIGDLANLETLLVFGNKLTKLPESIGGLANLKDFKCFKNQLSPNSEIAFLSAIEGRLPNLTSVTLDFCRTQRDEGTTSTLDCSERKLAELPERIGDLANLETLLVFGNKLTKLPESIGALANLKDFRCYKNQLTGEYYLSSSPHRKPGRIT